MRYVWVCAAALLLALGAYESTRTAPPKPTAVLIDKSTGRRFEIASGGGSTPLKARLDGAARLAANIDLAGSGDLESRKRRAYGALLGTVAAAALALLYIRRSIKG